MFRLVPALLLAIATAGCSQPTTPEPAPPAPAATPPPAPTPNQDTSAAAPSPVQDECAHVAQLFDMLVQKKAEGWLEKDAIADMSARGEYALGYVVDGVFGDRFGPGGTTAAKVDTLAACRRLAKGGQLY